MQRNIVSFLICTIVLALAVCGCAKKKEPAKGKVITQEKSEENEPLAEAKRLEPSGIPITEERVLDSFEKDEGGWEIPDWALEKDDHVAEKIEVSEDIASEGKQSLKVNCNFPGKSWTAAVVELEQFLDCTPYRQIAVDVYIPKDAPLGLRAKIILTVGDDWKFTEMTRAIPLIPGEWVTIKGNIEPGSYDWKRTVPDESFRADIRKIVVRITSNKRPVYEGPVYIDNVRIGK